MCRLLTPQLEEALKDYPLYSQDGKGKEAVCIAIFAIGSVRWFILEGESEEDDTILFGIVIGLLENEYGYISLNELSGVELDLTAQGFGKLQVRQQLNFQPTPLKLLSDNRLQRFLARFEKWVISQSWYSATADLIIIICHLSVFALSLGDRSPYT